MSVTSISSILDHALSGEPWHGLSLDVILGDVTPEEAAAHPIPGAHSILELVLHMAAWAGEATERAGGRAPRPPEEGDFPPTDGVTFAVARERLARAHARLSEALAKFPESALGEIVGGAVRDPALGSGVTFERLFVGVAEHDAYHGGQVAILKRALRGA
jgi:uncharacterized damage-inducible protein DinB